MELKIKHFTELTLDELYELMRARQEVFVVEQDCAYLDADGKDKNACHVFITENGKVLAALRVLDRGVLYDDVSISRVITTMRGAGLGEKVLLAGIEVAREKYNADVLRVSAQVRASGFYQKYGFKQVSDVYLENGIERFEMMLTL